MNDFKLTLADLGNTAVGNVETLFAQANGFLGVRANEPIAGAKATPGSFVNGFYETHPIVYGENAFGYAKNHETMVKLFDLRSLKIEFDNGEILSNLIEKSLELDMKTGILQEKFVYETPSGKQLQLDLESFASHADRRVYAQRWTVTALNFSASVKFDKRAWPLKPAADAKFDPRVRDASTELIFDGNKITTANSHLSLFVKFDRFLDSVKFDRNDSFSFTQLYQISRQNDFTSQTYDELRAAQVQIFQDFWAKSDIEITGDARLQKGIRVNLYHLFNSAGRDGLTNFSAKGLTGEGYEGHYFWDTEMYLLPFFIYTQPEIAKALLTYRLNVLPQARERARELDFAGALFAWRTQSGQETSAYYPAGTAQLHINGDIAYAFKLYGDVTGDADFVKQSRDVIYETARFWLSYGFFSPRGFEIHEVTGPDEYTALVNNNYYTNKMAQNNLRYAAELSVKFDENPAERENWSKAAQTMYFGYDEARQITKQDDSFLDKQPWDFESTPAENYPLLLHYHPMKIYKHQVLKQADTVLAQMLFGTDPAQIARDFDFYEPLTTHDSSLSRAIHGVVASRLGRPQQAYDFFAASATMDLTDLQGNARDGIHAANMGGSWLGLIYGFAGLHLENGDLKFANHLPTQIQKLKFQVQYQGETRQIELRQDH